MVKAGLFNDVDAAITWHPSTNNGVMSFRLLATTQHCFTFKGGVHMQVLLLILEEVLLMRSS